MPPDPPDDERRDEPPADEGSDDRDRDGTDSPDERSSNGDLLSSLLKALESIGRASRTGGRRGRGRRLDYDISIGSGLDSLDSGSASDRGPGRSPGPAHSRGRPSSGQSNRKRRRRSTSAYRTTVRTADEQLVVVADVAGADPDDVAVGYDDRDLVIGVDGTEIERVEVPWPDPSANARVKNGVLTVTIERGGEGRE